MEQAKTLGFLEDFPAISTAEWEARIMEDLKGADYRKRLVWKTPDGILVMPYYRAEHLASLPHLHSLPGQPPYVRGKSVQSNQWDVCQDIEEDDPVAANASALKAVAGGAGALGLNAAKIDNLEQLKQLLQGIRLPETALHIRQARDYTVLSGWLLDLYGQTALRGSLNFDPLGFNLLFGKPDGGLNENIEQAAALFEASGSPWPDFKLITVNGQHFHNAGAGIVQELAFTLSQANEYMVRLTDKGLNPDDIARHLQFRLAVGSDYFPEIAKLRAIKMLWSDIVAQYHPKKEKSRLMSLHVESSLWNKGIYDPYVNLLRSATEAMAAAIGGIDSMTLHPFDAPCRKSDAFSQRLARNQQIILSHEAGFDKVADPAAGSYYIENLTDMIARAVWELFVKTEAKGGFVKAVESGFIREEIAETCRRRDMDIAMRRQVFVGVNQYPDAKERVLGKLQPGAKPDDRGGLRPYRGPQAFEALRLDVEKHESRGLPVPKVFLLTYGQLAMRKARASFSTNFFGIAGYDIREGAGYKDVDAAVKDALTSGAHVVVLCSSDEEYAELIVAAGKIKEQKPATLVVVAGNPSGLTDQLRESGVDQFIHLRSNALESLQWFNEKLLNPGE